MHVIGSIDNAIKKAPDGARATCHIIITLEKLVIVQVLDRHKEIKEHPVNGSIYGGGARGSYIGAQKLQKELIDEAYKRGKEIENNIEEYLNSNPTGLKVIQYNEIKKAILSRGSLFSLPNLDLFTDDDELSFKLIHNNFEGNGKLTPETLGAYSKSLERVLGEKLELK